MSLLPITVRVTDRCKKLVSVCAIEEFGPGRTCLRSRLGVWEVALPFDVVEKELIEFYEQSEAPYFDLTDDRVAALRQAHNLNEHPQQEGNTAREPAPGVLVPRKGVYLGVWSPRDRSGKSLGKTFNLYAAPHDLGLDEQGRGSKLFTTYGGTVKAVGKIIDLMGHAGAKYKNDTELYKALRDGSYKGEWFIPTLDILNGKDVGGSVVQNDHLFAYRHTGALAGTFTSVGNRISELAHWYWSCQEIPDNPHGVYAVRLSDGVDEWFVKEEASAFDLSFGDGVSSRLVRAEPRP